jgi:hypothetical protein
MFAHTVSQNYFFLSVSLNVESDLTSTTLCTWSVTSSGIRRQIVEELILQWKMQRLRGHARSCRGVSR